LIAILLFKGAQSYASLFDKQSPEEDEMFTLSWEKAYAEPTKAEPPLEITR
jgi:hypothetical protein